MKPPSASAAVMFLTTSSVILLLLSPILESKRVMATTSFAQHKKHDMGGGFFVNRKSRRVLSASGSGATYNAISTTNAALRWSWGSLRGGGGTERDVGGRRSRVVRVSGDRKENNIDSGDGSDGRSYRCDRKGYVFEPARVTVRGGGDTSSSTTEVAASDGGGEGAAAAPLPGGTPVRVASIERRTDAVSSESPGTAAASAPAAPAASKPVVVDPKEEALRTGLLKAQGASKILREVERIPALRRLSDSALRVTSATDADGRLAALALYRLGSAARAAENTLLVPAAAPAAPSVAGSGVASDVSTTSSAAATAVDHYDDEGKAVVDGSAAPKDNGGQEHSNMVGVAGDIKALSSPKGHKNVVTDDTGLGSGLVAPHVVSAEAKNGLTTSRPQDTQEAAEEGRSPAEFPIDSQEEEPSEKQESEKLTEGGQTAADTEALTPPPAAPPIFDMEKITSDLRFEQLVEIVECTASRMSLSDVSKVVWGLSFLGHVPRNSLLETLAGLVTKKFHDAASLSTAPPLYTVTAAGGNANVTASSPSSITASDKLHVESSSTAVLTSGTTPEQGLCGESACVDGMGGKDTEGMSSTAGVDDRARTGGDGGLASGQGTGKLAAGAGGGARAVPNGTGVSGTDLATAALSFAYAHVRLDISTGELLDVIATCAMPALSSMHWRDLSSLVWAFAVQRRLDEELMIGVAHEIATPDRAVGRMSAKDASIFAWSYGMLGLRPRRVIRVLMRESLSTMGDASVHDVSNLAWGLARAGVDGRELEVDDDDVVSSESNTTLDGDQGVAEKQTGGRSLCGDGDLSPPLSDDDEDDDESESGVAPRPWGWRLRRGTHTKRDRDRRQNLEAIADSEQEGDGAERIDSEGSSARRSNLVGLVNMTKASAVGAGGGDDAGSDLDDEVEERLVEHKIGEAVLAKAAEHFRVLQPRQLARLCWAFGAWHEQGVVLSGAGPFALRALTEAGRHPRNYTAEELAQILWAFATLVGNADSPGQELAGLVGALTAGFEMEGQDHFALGGIGGGGGGGVGGGSGVGGGGLDAASACDVLWSLATMGHPAHGLCEALGRSLVDQVQELPPSSIASLAFAHAKMGHPSSELIERVLSVVERRLDDFAAEEAANVLWALGALGYTVSLKRQFHVKMEDLRSLNPSAVANLLWGLVKTEAAFADGFERECIEAVAADMGPKLLSFSPRELCRTAWALGRLGSSRAGVSVVAGNGDDGESEDGTASAERVHGGGEFPGLLDKVLGECSKWLELFNPQELETVLWAVCRLEHRADELVAAMANEAKVRQEGLAALIQQSGPGAARDAAFHLGAFRHLLTAYKEIDFDGQRAKGRYRKGKSMLSRMFRER